MHSAGKTLLALTLCFFSLFFSCRSAWAIQEPTLYAEAAILIRSEEHTSELQSR